jgi:hypothetical protein
MAIPDSSPRASAGLLMRHSSLLVAVLFCGGALRTKCGSRTGGWSLSGVMSD